MDWTQTLMGLYAITDQRQKPNLDLSQQVALALAGHARVIQYRDKGDDRQLKLRQATDLKRLCRQAGVPLVINDDLELAQQISADGVHLGIDDPDPARARRRLGPDALIGVSCYNSFERALQARRAGASYVAFGRFFPSATKPNAVQAELELLRRARRELRLPTVAIGGITPENGVALIEAGADMLAVISAVFAAPDVEIAARAFTACFNRAEETDR